MIPVTVLIFINSVLTDNWLTPLCRDNTKSMTINRVNTTRTNPDNGNNQKPVGQYNLNNQYFQDQYDQLTQKLTSMRGRNSAQQTPSSPEEKSVAARLQEVTKILDGMRQLGNS